MNVVHLHEQIRLAIQEHKLLSPGQRILVAVSGGVDSMVLLDALGALAPERGWKLTVAHVNHQLRGVSSAADERLVRNTAKQMKLPVVMTRADVRGLAKRQGISLEMAARQVRHEFLARTARHYRIPRIALAHHQDDQIEHFFLRLLRGTGGHGLAGMKWLSLSPSDPGVALVRPLLVCNKELILRYAAERGVRFREDSTNACIDIRRNRIRHELLPLLRRHYQPGLDGNILRVMNIVGAEAEFATSEAEQWLRIHGNGMADLGLRGGAEVLDRGTMPGEFDQLPVAVQRQIIQMQLLRYCARPEYDVVEHLREHPEKPIEVSGESTNCNFASEASRAEVRGDNATAIRLIRRGASIESLVGSIDFQTGFRKLDLRTRGKTDWHGVKFSWHTDQIAGLRALKKRLGSEFFDADMVGGEVRLRHWHAGDRFQPIGMKHAVKLQDLFVNQKVPHGERRRAVVGTSANGEIFWVEGMRISERFKLTEQTIRRLHWSWQRL